LQGFPSQKQWKVKLIGTPLLKFNNPGGDCCWKKEHLKICTVLHVSMVPSLPRDKDSYEDADAAPWFPPVG